MLLADRGYDADWIRGLAMKTGRGPTSPEKQSLRSSRKRDVTAAGHYAAIACEPGVVHFQGSSSSIFVFG